MTFDFDKKAKPMKGQEESKSTLSEMLSNTISLTAGTPDGKPFTMKRTMRLMSFIEQLDDKGKIVGDEESAKELERFIEDSAFAVFVKAQLFSIIDDARLAEKESSKK